MFDLKTYYENFALDNETVSLTVIVWAICIGLSLGVIFYTFSRHCASGIVKKLGTGEYNSKEKTATLASLGIKASPLLKKSLGDGKPLRRYIQIANLEECLIERKKGFLNGIYRFFRGEDLPNKYDFKKAEFYLPDDARPTAETRFETKGSPYLTALLFSILFLLCAVGISFCLPKLLELVDAMISAYKNL
ncbi:MAG: hypothetical protein E7647_07830 [Ruminococcaceae bacterium]|nr:hypothetical protein [Oscillospiraceae bacterium]